MPRKAAYESLANDPELEFEHYLAEKLGGMTVAEMRARMGNREFITWGMYYARKAQKQQLAAKGG